MAENRAYLRTTFGAPYQAVSELGALVEKLAFLVRSRLWLQILTGMVVGIAVGLLVSPNGYAVVTQSTAELITGWLVLPGHIFLALIQMIMLPLVMSSIVLGIADTEDSTKLKRMGLRIAPYFIGTTTAAVLIGVIIVSIIEPRKHLNPEVLANTVSDGTAGGVTARAVESDVTLHDRIVGLIPANPLSAALDERML